MWGQVRGQVRGQVSANSLLLLEVMTEEMPVRKMMTVMTILLNANPGITSSFAFPDPVVGSAQNEILY